MALSVKIKKIDTIKNWDVLVRNSHCGTLFQEQWYLKARNVSDILCVFQKDKIVAALVLYDSNENKLEQSTIKIPYGGPIFFLPEKIDYRRRIILERNLNELIIEFLINKFEKIDFSVDTDFDDIIPYIRNGFSIEYRFTDSNLNHTGIYLYSKGKIMIHLTFDYKSDKDCTTPGQYLKYHRTFQSLTTRELAEKVGIVPATLVLYENDRHPIKYNTAVALANELGIDRNRLLDEYAAFVDCPYSSLLKRVRQELSLTQMQMAKAIGIGQTTYSGWERESRIPRRKEHEKILAAMKKLKVDVGTYLCQ